MSEYTKLYMNAVYCAIADGKINPDEIAAFGNGIDRMGSDYVEYSCKNHPVIREYMGGEHGTLENAFQRYSEATKDRICK